MVYAQHIIIGHWHFGIMGPRNRTITYTTVRDPITNLGVAHTRGERIVKTTLDDTWAFHN